MVLLITKCNHCSCTLTRFIKYRPSITRFNSSRVLLSSCTDAFVENLILEESIKKESSIAKYFKNVQTQDQRESYNPKITLWNKNLPRSEQLLTVEDMVYHVEKEIKTKDVPNEKLQFLLVYFTKDGNVNGVKAVQAILEKHNMEHFKSHSMYNHYLAEALWINGKIHVSLQLFSGAYDNIVVRPKVKVMLASLFPLLIEQHSEAKLCNAICHIESFSAQKQDDLILACLWRELFQSTWFSDQAQAAQLLHKNKHVLKITQWMVPAMGKQFLRSHRIEDFNRLIQFTLENEFKSMTGVLLRLMFQYYYIHQNIERCTAVVKYSSNLNSPLTEDQQRRYVKLLLRSKDAVSSKLNIKEPQNLEYKF